MKRLIVSVMLLMLAFASAFSRAETRQPFNLADLGFGAYAGYSFNADFSNMFLPFNGGCAGAQVSYGKSRLAFEGGAGFSRVNNPFVTSSDLLWTRDESVEQYRISMLYGYCAKEKPTWDMLPSVKVSYAFFRNRSVDEQLGSISLQAGCTGSFSVGSLGKGAMLVCPGLFAGADWMPGYGWAPSVCFGLVLSFDIK